RLRSRRPPHLRRSPGRHAPARLSPRWVAAPVDVAARREARPRRRAARRVRGLNRAGSAVRPGKNMSVGLAVALLVALAGSGWATTAALNAETKNPSNQFAATSLPQPVVVSSHASVINGQVTVTWTSTPTSFATSYQIQRSTSSSGPFTTV